MSYPDVSLTGEGSDYRRQQQPLAPAHGDGRPSAPAFEDVNRRWHNPSLGPHRATTIAGNQHTPPPSSLGLDFYNGVDDCTQLGHLYAETHQPYTSHNGGDRYSQWPSEGSLDNGYDTGYNAGRYIDNRRGYQGRQRSSLSPPRYAGPAFAYSPYHGGHIANGDHRYRHRSSVSPATPTMASTSANSSAYTPAQRPESENVKNAAYHQYRPNPLPNAAMYAEVGYRPSARVLAEYLEARCRYTNDYSLARLGATSWVKTLEKANLQPRLTFPDMDQCIEQAGGSEGLYPLAFSGQRCTRRRIGVAFDVAPDGPNLKKVKQFTRGLTVHPRVAEETTNRPCQVGDSSSVLKASLARTEIAYDRIHGDTVATAGKASSSKQSRKRNAPADDYEARGEANRSRDDNGIVETKGSASTTSKAKKTTSETPISEKKAGKRRAVAEDTWTGSELPRPLSPFDKTRRRYRRPAQPGTSSGATTYSRTTVMRMDQVEILARDGVSSVVQRTEID
ncbi:hypothetical protein EYR40_009117 [Pleurotus pulmonarius]|nr:hypothetical protein EYR40_009117 [Pleurotus pulmonarius]